PNHLLFWHAIRAACERGCRWFDFGRTDIGQEGLRNFKLSWGAVEEPLVYATLDGQPGSAPPAEGMAVRLLGPVIRHGPLVPRRPACAVPRARRDALPVCRLRGRARDRGHLR